MNACQDACRLEIWHVFIVYLQYVTQYIDRCDTVHYYRFVDMNSTEKDKHMTKFFKCQKCGRELGQLLDGGLRLTGGVVIHECHGICANCGEEFHYSTKTAILRKILDVIHDSKLGGKDK